MPTIFERSWERRVFDQSFHESGAFYWIGAETKDIDEALNLIINKYDMTEWRITSITPILRTRSHLVEYTTNTLARNVVVAAARDGTYTSGIIVLLERAIEVTVQQLEQHNQRRSLKSALAELEEKISEVESALNAQKEPTKHGMLSKHWEFDGRRFESEDDAHREYRKQRDHLRSKIGEFGSQMKTVVEKQEKLGVALV